MSNTRLQQLILLVGLGLLVAKFFAYYLTGSGTVLTDAMESIINVAAGALTLFSLRLSARPKDENHPYGHGKVEFISAGIEGTLIFLAAFFIIAQSIWSLCWGESKLQHLDLGLLIAALAGAINYLMGHISQKQGKKSGSLALEAAGEHLKSDAYSTVGLLLGLGLVYALQEFWQLPYWAGVADNLAAISFGLFIGYSGYNILRRSVAGIMDEVDYELMEQVVQLLEQNRYTDWVDIHNLRIIKYGPNLHIDCHLTLPWYYNARQTHEELDRLEELLHSQIDPSVEIFVHIDPCLPSSCHLCTKSDCPQRQSPFLKKVEWNRELVMRNKKH